MTRRQPSSAERSLMASANAHRSWSLTRDRSSRTAPARAALERRFLDQADGDPKRADSLRRAYYKQLAARSVRARRLARQQVGQASPRARQDEERGEDS